MINQVKDSKNSINITWLPPSNNSGINETIFYDIQCLICAVESVCNKSCTDLQYAPSRNNITQTSVLVYNLVGGQMYEFRIFPKNSLNRAIPRSEWKYIAKRFTLEQRGSIFNSTIFTNDILNNYRKLGFDSTTGYST